MDYKDWIQNKAEELALEQHNTDYYGLPKSTRHQLYDKACELYKDHYAGQIDAAYEAALEARLVSGCRIDN